MKNNFQQLMEMEEEQVQLPSGMRRQLGERLKVLQALGTLFDVYVHQAFRGGLELSNVLSSTAAEVTLIDCAPFKGPLTLHIGDKEYSLGYQAAQSVLVIIREEETK